MGIPSMQSGTCDIQLFHNVKQFTRLCILPQYQSGQVEVLRSLDHVLWFLVGGKKGSMEDVMYFMWQVSEDGK